MFHGPAEGENAEMKEMTWSEGAVMVPFLAAIFFMGLYPAPVIERMEPAVDALVQHIEDNVDDFDEAVRDEGKDVELEDLIGLGDKDKDKAAAEGDAAVVEGSDG